MRVKKPLIISIRNVVSNQAHPRIQSSGSYLFSTAPSLTTAEELPNRGKKIDEITDDPPPKYVHISSNQSKVLEVSSTEPKHVKQVPYSKQERQNSTRINNPNSSYFQQKKLLKLQELAEIENELIDESARVEIKKSFQAGNPYKILSSYKKLR